MGSSAQVDFYSAFEYHSEWYSEINIYIFGKR